MTESSPEQNNTAMKYPINVDAVPLIKLSDMAQRREIRTASEDWTGITSSAERRKLQNRLNQRAYGEHWLKFGSWVPAYTLGLQKEEKRQDDRHHYI
jgi:hypothetical protein